MAAFTTYAATTSTTTAVSSATKPTQKAPSFSYRRSAPHERLSVAQYNDLLDRMELGLPTMNDEAGTTAGRTGSNKNPQQSKKKVAMEKMIEKQLKASTSFSLAGALWNMSRSGGDSSNKQQQQQQQQNSNNVETNSAPIQR
mmetsp:Transcript_9627/g.20717  ORF Transcript_9627/g.20717 Transcript_9627/m.20717 type:complete len:142 (-) Transcript_9627:167-592(-)